MSPLQDVQDKATDTRAIDVLADDTRRRILRLLSGRTTPTAERTLAEELAAGCETDEDETTVERFQLRLRHVHLPKLAECGLVSWDREERTVADTDTRHDETDDLETLVTADERTAMAGALADERRRAIVDHVTSAPGPVGRSELASRLTGDTGATNDGAADANDVAVQLHHRHLPALEAAGLVEYDTEAGTVTYAGPGDGSALLAAI